MTQYEEKRGFGGKMTLAEIAKKFPLGSYVLGTERGYCPDELGIVLGHREALPDQACMRVAWFMGLHDTFERQSEGTFPEEVEPFGEIEAVKKLIEFAGRLLQDSPATIGRSEVDELGDAIAICEGVYGI